MAAKKKKSVDTSGDSVVALSANFTLAELTFSQTAARMGIDNVPDNTEIANLRALCRQLLQPLRNSVGYPVVVSSGFRSPTLNRLVGGAATSQHMRGEAADILVPPMSVIAVFKRVLDLNLPFNQLIYEGGRQSQWVHVSHSRSQQRGEILLATFPPAGGVLYRRLTKTEARDL